MSFKAFPTINFINYRGSTRTLTPSPKAKANSTSIKFRNENIEISINLPGNIKALRVAGGSL